MQTAEQTEGPFYFHVDRMRSDIREDREGAVLRLGVRVRDTAACEPISNAVVDVWHGDASGDYSGFEGNDGETYLRGARSLNGDGIYDRSLELTLSDEGNGSLALITLDVASA